MMVKSLIKRIEILADKGFLYNEGRDRYEVTVDGEVVLWVNSATLLEELDEGESWADILHRVGTPATNIGRCTITLEVDGEKVAKYLCDEIRKHTGKRI